MKREIVIAVAGVTGRMGSARHLRGVLIPLAAHGLTDGEGRSRIAVRLVLVGRDGASLAALAAGTGASWSTDVDAVLRDPAIDVYFDARRPDVRPSAVRIALDAGKHVYVEKPLSLDAVEADELAALATARGVRTGIVHDKLFTPGFRALQACVRAGALGEVLDVRGSFGYWVHDGTAVAAQRPSWNYRSEAGGSLVPDLFSHWSYLLEIVGRPVSVAALTARHVRRRIDELGEPYDVTVDDVSHVLARFDTGATATISSAWVQRPMTPFTLTVHGRRATAVARPDGCWLTDDAMGNGAPWEGGPDGCWVSQPLPSGDEFALEWVAFLRHVAYGAPFDLDFAAAARAARLCAAIEAAAAAQAWIDVQGRASRGMDSWAADGSA